MKRAIIAGFVAGLAQAVLNISGFWELFSVHSFTLPVSIQNDVLSRIILFSLWGIVWGLLYAFFYDYVPAKGVKKGFVYSIIVWMGVTVHPAVIYAIYGFYKYLIPWLLTGFISVCIIYGFLIGILYKKE